MLIMSAVCYHITNKGKFDYIFSEDAIDGSYVLPEAGAGEAMKETEPSCFQIQINGQPQVNGQRCNLMAGNPVENKVNVQVFVTLDDTGEEICRSDILAPGQRHAYVNLNRQLSSGQHDATAVFCFMGPDGEKYGEIEAGLLLIKEY